MVEAVPVLSPKATVGEAIVHLRQHARSYSSVAYVYLADAQRMLVGVVSIKEILTHSEQTILVTIAKDSLITVTANMRAEAVALMAIKHRLKAVPVVDDRKRLLGVVTPDVIRDILHYARIDDTLIHAGAPMLEDSQNSLLSGSASLHIRKRFPWLLLGLGGGIVAALIVQAFEEALAVNVLLVAFLPLVVYMADAVGSQTEIIFVRALALDTQLNKWSRYREYVTREFTVTGTLAVVFGLIVASMTSWWFKAPELVLVMFVSLVSTILLAALVALAIPYSALKLRFDPALTSGPVATMVRDVLTLVVYFVIAINLL